MKEALATTLAIVMIVTSAAGIVEIARLLLWR